MLIHAAVTTSRMLPVIYTIFIDGFRMATHLDARSST
jgi:hypothetical protein